MCPRCANEKKIKNENSPDMNAFHAPLARGIIKLDRCLFSKTLNLSAAALNDVRNLSRYRKMLEKRDEILLLRGRHLSPIQPHPDGQLAAQGRKCLVLDQKIKAEGARNRAICSVHLADFL
jgi:tRNA (guanine37-N1)-methyltransferase